MSLSLSSSGLPTLTQGSKATTPETFHWEGAATLNNVRQGAHAARQFLKNLGFSDEEGFQWEILLTEAGNNTVLHAGAADISVAAPLTIDLQVQPDKVVARIQDQSAGFVWPAVVTLPEAEDESGRGLFILNELSDQIDYQRGTRGNTLLLERRHEENLTAGRIQKIEALEDTLDDMTRELAACYESLASVFHFSEECREDNDLRDLSSRLLEHLTNAIGADCSTLRLSSLETCELKTWSTVSSSPMDDNAVPSSEGRRLEAKAIEGGSDQWIDNPLVNDPMPSSDPAKATVGIVHPFYDGETLMGVVSIGKTGPEVSVSASDLQIIHTLSDLLGQKIKDRRRAAIEMESRVQRHEIGLAATIQRSFLPYPSPNQRALQATGFCQSAMDVGGDFYDLIEREDGSTVFVIADVMGKGLGASMLAAITRSVIRTVAHRSSSPSEMLQEAAQRLHDDFERLEMFVTVAIGLVDPKDKVLCVANAGHCPVAVHVPRRQDILIEPSALPLGLEAAPTIGQQVISLTEGAHILAFTDGLLDPRSERHFESPDEVLQWMQREPLADLDAESFKDSLREELNASQGGAADDVTFVNLHLPTS